MRKVLPGIIFGLLLVGIGAIFLLNAVGVTSISLAGWWTLFIIVPCMFSIITNRPSAWNVGGLLLGLWLLSREQHWLPENLDERFALGFIAVAIGLMLIVSAFTRNRPSSAPRTAQGSDSDLNYSVLFGGQDINHTGLITGGSLSAVFGGIELDLRQATVMDGAVISVSAFCGGMEITPPPGVKVMITGTPIFGGYENKAVLPTDPGAPTLTFHVSAVFGGVEIKRA